MRFHYQSFTVLPMNNLFKTPCRQFNWSFWWFIFGIIKKWVKDLNDCFHPCYLIRVNILHPDCVYDTGLWTQEALELSAKRYGLSVEQYKSRNILKTDVKTKEVARMVCAMVGPVFSKTTGAHIPIDGGSERVI